MLGIYQIAITKPLSISKSEHENDNAELQQISKVLNHFKINAIGKRVNFCSR